MTAHPRGGGENCADNGHRPGRSGSSPRGRGKPWREHGRVDGDGLIPAGAGKTMSTVTRWPGARAHPRGGGENAVGRDRHGVERGSSPRGRGKPTCTIHRVRCIGLIPAGAGKTDAVATDPPPCPAHPRGGGENEERQHRPVIALGSSPRGRGKQGHKPANQLRNGLIPAGAGKTYLRDSSRTMYRAHPRGGGENAWPVPHALQAQGSSPRGRGKP